MHCIKKSGWARCGIMISYRNFLSGNNKTIGGCYMIGNMYNVLLGDAVNAHNNYVYYARSYDLLTSNKEKYTPKTFFVNDMFEAFKNSVAGCLMRLYDKSKNTLTVIDFLKALKKEPDTFFKGDAEHYKRLIKEDINRLGKNHNVIEVLNKIRNKKYFHNSIEYATHHSVIDPLTQRSYELKIEEIKDLIEMTLRITKNYQDLFSKNVDTCLIPVGSIDDIFLLLERHCFSTRVDTGYYA